MKRIKFVVFFLVIVFSFSSNIYASGSVFLNPTSGVIDGNGKAINIVVDSGGGEISGLEMAIEYSGDIAFTGFDSGNISGCEVDGLERDTEEFDDIFLYCFILTDPYTGSDGVFATLNFESTAEGQAVVEIVDVEAAGTVTITDGSGSYSTTLQIQETTSDPEPEETAPLPRTSIFNAFGIMFGVGLICMPLILNKRSTKPTSLMMGKVR